MRIQQSLDDLKKIFEQNSTTPRLDAELLIAASVGEAREWLYAHPELTLTLTQQKQLQEMVDKRLGGMPIAYIFGEKEFFGRTFFVDKRVLIPRPETEELVEHVLAYAHQKHSPTHPVIIDIGTGSGCIATTIKKELPNARMIATDISEEALAVAQRNATTHQAQVDFFCGDLLQAIPETYQHSIDILISNPPYVEANVVDAAPSALTSGLQHEPRHALVPHTQEGQDADALYTIDRILSSAQTWLAPNGAALFLEIGDTQGEHAQQLATHYYPHATIRIAPDHAGHDRFLIIEL